MTQSILLKPWSILIGLLLITILLIIVFNMRPPLQLADSKGMTIVGESQLMVHQVSLITSPVISHTSGIHDSPIGVSGESKYVYDGDIQVCGRQHAIHLVDHEPLAAIELGIDMYIVAQGYFNSNKQSFLFCQLKDGHTFTQISVGQVPTDFWRLTFQEADQNCLYRVWLLNALARDDSIDNAISCFELLISLDPRFGFLQHWREMPRTPGEDISSFVRGVLVPRKRKEIVPLLGIMIEQFKRSDNPKMMKDVCHSLIELDRGRAIDVICALKKSIPNTDDREDMRVYTLTSDSQLSEINCP